MRYLCLVYHDEAAIEAMPEGNFDAFVRDVLAYRETLKQGSHYIASSPLQPVRTATTIRVRHGQTFITDGPFAETKEHLAGFYLIEAADLNDAIRLAAKMPPARFGSIEVRPLAELACT
ncbi:MAG TPA: YciI family protein [Thermomicrobiales bacterium]|nr:YciI family protein [Thermomicrobiales bacterium]